MKIRLRSKIKLGVSCLRSIGKTKIFCIGKNKTGTTSIAKALRDLGIIVAPQRPAERLLHDWAKRDFRRIIRFCYTSQAFQDIPFSLPFTFQILDVKFPGSKFILTVRDSSEQWYSSITRFHSKIYGGGKIPDYNALKNAQYCYPGYALEANQLIIHAPNDDLYNKATMIKHYEFHNQSVMEYFHHRQDDLLVINLAEKGAYAMFCKFIGKPCTRKDFPWENKTENIEVRNL